MALQINEIYTSKGEGYTQEPIMVTITLGEYRSLIEETTRQNELLCKAQDEINRLQREVDCLNNRKFDRYKETVGDDK